MCIRVSSRRAGQGPRNEAVAPHFGSTGHQAKPQGAGRREEWQSPRGSLRSDLCFFLPEKPCADGSPGGGSCLEGDDR